MEKSRGKMKAVKYVAKTIMVILTYFILLMFGRVIMFWTHMLQATSVDYDWRGKHGFFLFWAPFDTQSLFAIVLAVLLFLIFHGRNVYPGRWKQIRQISKKFWQELWVKAAVLAGSLFGVMWYGVDSLEMFFAYHIVSWQEIYYFLSGTTIFQRLPDAGGSEVVETLEMIGFIFRIHMSLDEIDLINMGIAFIVYELLRICFDKTVPLKKTGVQSGES